MEQWFGRNLYLKWGVSRARETKGYALCTLCDHTGQKLARCNGGGYDMRGTVFATWMCDAFKDELCALKPKDFPENSPGRKHPRSFYGLSFHNPNYDPSKAVIKTDKGVEMTLEDAEKAGELVLLQRYQAFFAASSPTPSKVFTEPYMNGSCGYDCVKNVMHAIGLEMECLDYKMGLYRPCAYDPKNPKY